jgi:hypothetical protein
LYLIIGLGFTNAPAYTVPNSLAQHHKQYTGPLIDIEEYCYGVVHPVTKESITHYRKLIKDPLLKDLWIVWLKDVLVSPKVLTQFFTSHTLTFAKSHRTEQ